jgi:hypothetical protein
MDHENGFVHDCCSLSRSSLMPPQHLHIPARPDGFVLSHAQLARQALAAGEVRAARAALRVLVPDDFGRQRARAEGLMAVLRDRRATDEEIALIAAAMLSLLGL